MRIHIVAPITTPGLSGVSDFAPYAAPETTLTHDILDSGPASLESRFDEALAVPDLLRKFIAARGAGADAAVIDCMTDPGLGAAREATGMLVLGAAQTSIMVASLLAHDFSIVTTSAAVVPVLSDLVTVYGLSDKLRSIRSVEVPVLDLRDEERLRTALFAQSLAAVRDDGAHAVVFGCTGMRGWADAIREHLAAEGFPGIPVIDPAPTTLKIAEALSELGLSPSQRSYPAPAQRTAAGYEDLAPAEAR
jgi:allantoin racemase